MDTETKELPKENVILIVSTIGDGQLKIQGEIMKDKLACYGLLEAIRDLVQEFHNKNKPVIVKPNGGIMNYVRNGKNE